MLTARQSKLSIRTFATASMAIALSSLHPASAWTGDPSPLDGHHLAVVRPDDWRLSDGPRFQPSLAANQKENPFRQIVTANRPLSAFLYIKKAGRYDLWIRVGQRGGAMPLEAELLRGGKAAFSDAINNGAGEVGRGGPAGYKAYREKAELNVPGGASTTIDLLDKGNDNVKSNIVDEMGSDEEKEQKRWINSFRLDKVEPRSPVYWWKINGAQLEPGSYELRIKAPNDSKNAPLLDAAFLTTNTKLVYPFSGDIDATPSNYVRFRIDDLGKGKAMKIGLRFLVHYRPFRAEATANPDGFPKDPLKTAPHVKTGYTRWYRLNDVEHVSSNGNFTLSIDVPNEARGISQFATFPHEDAVLHEFDWNGLDEKYLAVGTPANGFVYTGRDFSRLHYEYALNATGGKVFPMMRGDDLTLTGSWGNARGAAVEYMVKTLRLLGFNQISFPDAAKNMERYGGLNFAAIGPPGYLPYDEAEARQKMDEAFKSIQNRKDLEKVVRVQLADEPIEANTMEYSAPMWRFESDQNQTDKSKAAFNRPLKDDEGQVEIKPGEGDEAERKADGENDDDAPVGGDIPVRGRARWRDITGSSDLNTKRVDLQDCIFEGEFSGKWVGFRAGIDNAQLPTKFVYWRIGDLSKKTKFNVEYGRSGDEKGTQFVRKAAELGKGKATPFKIVFERGKAALFVNGAIMWEHEGVPEKGGFGIFGPEKSIYSLRLRPINADEHIDLNASKLMSDKLDAVGIGDGIELDERDFEEKPKKVGAESRTAYKEFVENEMEQAGGIPAAQVGFRKWCASKGLTPALFGQNKWDDVRMLTVTSLIENAADRRRYYWSRRYSSWLTPRMYGLAAEALRKNAPNKKVRGYVGLSGHALYMHHEWLPMDIMELAAQGDYLMAGVSDWMSLGGWRWDSLQSVAYSIAPMNGGARRYGKDWGQEPISYPMMHQVGPDIFRAYTMLSNQAKHISFWNFGPAYASTEGSWSDSPGRYVNSHFIMNRISQVDDILPKARMRPSRVAMLYSLSNEYWDPTASYSDKRATFLSLSHEYYQPDIVTEDQIANGALQHYDALYVLDTAVTSAAQEKIAQWTQNGGLLWACSGAATLNEYGEPLDLLAKVAGLERTFSDTPRDFKPAPEVAAQFGRRVPDDYLTPVAGETGLRAHSVFKRGQLSAVKWEGARVRARYADGVSAFAEKPIGKGKVFYLGHRAGFTYSYNSLHPSGIQTIWADIPRATLTRPLHEAKVERDVVISEPTVMTQPMSTPEGTVLMMYNMKPTASTNVKVGLLEPAKPVSVQGFAPRSVELKDIPFEYSDGRVWFTLPTLESHGTGTIVRIRRTPVPADPRKEELRAHTAAQLKSTDPLTISAGLWFAGLNPQWNMGDQAEVFLTHEIWQVRMAAAEALWRLDRKTSGDRILAAMQKEKDPHVQSEMLYALAKLGHTQAPALSLKYLANERDYVRRQAMRAVTAIVEAGTGNGATPTPALKKLAADATELARLYKIPNDNWGTPMGWKNQFLLLLEPKVVVDEAVEVVQAIEAAKGTAVSDPNSAWGADRELFSTLIASNDALFAEYARQGVPGDQSFVLALAQRRRAPELVKAMQEMIGKIEDENAGAFNKALQLQRDKALTRVAVARRAELPKTVAALLPVTLENTFGKSFGAVMTDWEKWLESNKG